eukprot:8085-Chlamydomonas_euryale.AAC.2
MRGSSTGAHPRRSIARSRNRSGDSATGRGRAASAAAAAAAAVAAAVAAGASPRELREGDGGMLTSRPLPKLLPSPACTADARHSPG